MKEILTFEKVNYVPENLPGAHTTKNLHVVKFQTCHVYTMIYIRFFNFKGRRIFHGLNLSQVQNFCM